MPKFNRASIYKLLLPVFIGILLLFIPLLGDFHIESALLVSLVGCFWAGIHACTVAKEKDDFYKALRILGTLFLVGFPLLIHALLTGCFSIHGLAFWLLFPLPSVYFGYAIGRLLRSWQVPYRRLITVAVLLVIGVGILLYELLHYPQVYFFNHVWGGWPGPIYDEVIHVDSATVFFRGLTLLWATLLWHIPELSGDRYAKWIIGFAAIGILLGYTQSAEFGILTPRSYLQTKLGGHRSTRHFELYYDQRFYTEHEIALLAKEHEFYYQQIADRLALSPADSTQKIESYLYGHPWQKKRLVGAKFTSYVPVWLDQDQLHIAKPQLNNSLKHELVHVMAKRFDNKLFHASWSVGLIEGLAVAIDGGDSSTSTIDQIVVSEKPYPTAKQLQQLISPRGFYGGRSGVNYLTSGSFVRWLLNTYPAARFKKAYPSGNIAKFYPGNWQELATGWHQHLDSVQVDSVDQQVAGRIFGIPSLFEQRCPHVVSDFAAAMDNYEHRLAERDTLMALHFLDRALTEADSLAPIKAEWSYRQLMSGNPQTVQQAASRQDTTVELQLLYADAFAMTGDHTQALPFINRAKKLFVQHPDSVLAPALATRLNRRQWQIYRQMTYRHTLPDSSAFSEAYYRTKIRSLRKALETEQWQRVESYATQLLTIPLHLRYFDDYQDLIHQLAFLGKRELAARLIKKMSAASLRNRYRERLDQEKEWLLFLSAQFCTPENQNNS